jgi:hypothetical protein
VPDPIRFPALAEIEERERTRLEEKAQSLRDRVPPHTEAAERIELILDNHPYVVDPVYIELQRQFDLTTQSIGDHHGGDLPSQYHGPPTGDAADDEALAAAASKVYTARIHNLTKDEKAFAAVYGMLLRDGKAPPSLDDPAFNAEADRWNENDDRYRRFVKAVAEARGEYNASSDLYDNILHILVRLGKVEHSFEVDLRQWALVGETLSRQQVSADDFQLTLRVQSAIGYSDPEDTAPSTIGISLPDLDAQSDLAIVRDNVVATQALYFSAALDDMLFFGVADKIRELFQLGMLPFGKSRGGDLIFAFTKRGINRMTEVERRNLYARTFGFPGGDPNVIPNREFSDLWLRFVSAVSEIARQVNLDNLLTSKRPGSVSQEQVRKAGRDLAANLSLHGYGVGYFAATELQTTIKEVIAILSSEDVKNAYGARDMYQVIDQVATLELGGARNTTRYRTIAQAGAVIIAWLATRADLLSSTGKSRVLDLASIYNGVPRDATLKATDLPTDGDLVDAVEQWLAVTGTADTQVEQYSQAVEGPSMTSRPIQIPAVARDLLASVGISSNGK